MCRVTCRYATPSLRVSCDMSLHHALPKGVCVTCRYATPSLRQCRVTCRYTLPKGVSCDPP